MIDLMKEYGRKYKVTLEESWDAENPENRTLWKTNGGKLWYYEIVGRTGKAYPHSETHTALELSPRMFKKWVPNFLYTIHRNCDDGPTVLIKNEDTKEALKWIGPRKKRTLSPEAKAKAVANLQKFRQKVTVGSNSEATI